MDIEANSLYAYRESICLIQVSTDDHDYIIDPLADFSLAPFAALLADPETEKVFHAAEYDISLLKGLHGWNICNLFDTMWAGRVLGFSKMGLAWFLDTLYDIKLSKKCQKADWATRPLSYEKLAYARNDTRYLLQMRDELEERLRSEGRLEEAREIFDSLRDTAGANRVFDPDDFWRLKGVRTMPPRAQAVLKALFVFRDREAKRRDVPPFKVVNNQVLMALASHAATWNGGPPPDLGKAPGVPSRLVERIGPRLMRAIKKGLNAPAPQYPKRSTGGTPGYWKCYESLMTWRKEVARRRGVESDVILSRKIVEEVAEKQPSDEKELTAVVSLGPWRRKTYGAEILRVIK